MIFDNYWKIESYATFIPGMRNAGWLTGSTGEQGRLPAVRQTHLVHSPLEGESDASPVQHVAGRQKEPRSPPYPGSY